VALTPNGTGYPGMMSPEPPILHPVASQWCARAGLRKVSSSANSIRKSKMNITLGIKALAVLAFVVISTASIVQLPVGNSHAQNINAVGAIVAVSGN